MTLLELLVKELPKRGGFPNGYNVACHGSMDLVCFHGGGLPPEVHDIPYLGCEVVTRDQYEAARAASQQPVWDGEGLPPVGLRIEYTCKRFSEHKQAILPEYWYGGVVIAYYEGFVWTSDNGIRPLENTIFRPIRTESERKREEAVSQLNNFVTMGKYTLDEEQAFAVYDAIAAGKIPGVKLTDGGE